MWCLGYYTGGEAAVSLTDCSFSWDGTRDSEKTTLQKWVPLFSIHLDVVLVLWWSIKLCCVFCVYALQWVMWFLLHTYLQFEPSSEARSASGCGGSGWSWQVLPHPGPARRDGETWRTNYTQGWLVFSLISFFVFFDGNKLHSRFASDILRISFPACDDTVTFCSPTG